MKKGKEPITIPPPTPTSTPPRIAAHTSQPLRNLRLYNLHNPRLRQRTQIPQLVRLARNNLAHDPAHDLPRARFGQVRHDVHLLRRGEGADDFADLDGELLCEGGFVGGVVFEFAVGGRVIGGRGRR